MQNQQSQRGKLKMELALDTKSYTQVIEYLISLRLTKKFQWCLDHFDPESV